MPPRARACRSVGEVLYGAVRRSDSGVWLVCSKGGGDADILGIVATGPFRRCCVFFAGLPFAHGPGIALVSGENEIGLNEERIEVIFEPGND